MYQKIVVAYDASPESRKALLAGLALAKRYRTGLCAVTVEEQMPPYLTGHKVFGARATSAVIDGQLRDPCREAQEEAQAIARDEGVQLDTAVVIGDEVGGIVEFARQHGADLLLVGFHKHSPLADRLLGSTAHGITLAAPCSVLAVK